MADAEKSETAGTVSKESTPKEPSAADDRQSTDSSPGQADSEVDRPSNATNGSQKKKSKKKKKKRQNKHDGKTVTSESESQSDAESKDRTPKAVTEETVKSSTEQATEGAERDSAKKKDVEEESEDEGIEELGNPEELDGAGRNTLFERAKQYESKGKKKCALKCYLQCLTGLKDAVGFSFLPQCLRRVADIYFEKEEFEKAIQFIQAEKMFYETALIDTSQLQTKLELAQQGKELEDGEGAAGDSEAVDPDTLRAEEYEKLARLCLEKQQPKLALEYQGKATKLRQKLYGDADTRTIASLDFFTVVYAEVGKQQYAESMEKLGSEASPEDVRGETPESPTSILRKRKKSKKQEAGESEKKQVRFENPPVTREQTFTTAADQHRSEREEWLAHTILLVLFVLCALSLAGVAAALYCRRRSPYHASAPCNAARAQLRYVGNVAAYYWHRYVASSWSSLSSTTT